MDFSPTQQAHYANLAAKAQKDSLKPREQALLKMDKSVTALYGKAKNESSEDSMTRTVARLILAMLLLPCTGAVFLLLFLILIPTSGPPAVGRLILLWSALYVFVGVYWIMLWRDLVPWNLRRIRLTALATMLSLVGGLAVALGCLAINRQIPPPIAVLIGGGTVPITWVLSTVLVWRETAAERLTRLVANGMPTIPCPLCGYNLSGLTEARCPECGANFTLEQLVLSRPRPVSQPTEL